MKAKIPLWLKLFFSLLFAVTIPANVINYSSLDLLWFCDISIVISFLGLWLESSLLISMAALASVGPQFVWQLDYYFHLISGEPLFGFTNYMFDPNYEVFPYIVSLFHVWMPFVLLYALSVVRYHRLAIACQSAVSCAVIWLSYVLTPDLHSPAGNLNMVYGLNDEAPQSWMHPWLWLVVVMAYCVVCVYYPSHFVAMRLFKQKGH